MKTKPLYTPEQLACTIAQIVEYAREDFTEIPAEIYGYMMERTAYIVACFVAQHTPASEFGVETEEAYVALRCGAEMPYAERLQLAHKFVADCTET